MDSVKCPYCKKEVKINYDDMEGFNPEELIEKECNHCKNSFVFTYGIIFNFASYEAPCLNGDDHKYEKKKRFPFENELICKWCGDTKIIDKEAHEKSISEYMNSCK